MPNNGRITLAAEVLPRFHRTVRDHYDVELMVEDPDSDYAIRMAYVNDGQIELQGPKYNEEFPSYWAFARLDPKARVTVYLANHGVA